MSDLCLPFVDSYFVPYFVHYLGISFSLHHCAIYSVCQRCNMYIYMLVHIHFKEVVRMKTFVTALIYIQVVYVCICNPFLQGTIGKDLKD